MPNPIDIFNLIIDFVGSFADMIHDPDERSQLIQVVLMSIVASTPMLAYDVAIKRYAKNRGRDLTVSQNAWKQQNPFVEPRLNEALAATKRSLPVVASVALIGALILVGLIENENVGIALGVAVGGLLGGTPRLFIETCLAFGAELAPEPEPSVALTG
ncbi:MAG: hypothetical protein JHC98_11100 [Thermoleophilaceae bacterium]|nr:hypothetical protein [Thermoleophilaceae bacterium]